jgi:hypothetical protein
LALRAAVAQARFEATSVDRLQRAPRSFNQAYPSRRLAGQPNHHSGQEPCLIMASAGFSHGAQLRARLDLACLHQYNRSDIGRNLGCPTSE